MRSIFKVDQPKILNLKFKKFKNLKKHNLVNKLKLSNFFMFSFADIVYLARRIVLLEALTGETFKITKFKFYNDNKKHAQLGALVFLKINVYKKKIFPCLSYFFIYQLFFYYEFFLKAKSFNLAQFSNYFWFKSYRTKTTFFSSFYFFICWSDFNEVFTNSIFTQNNEVFDTDEQLKFKYVNEWEINLMVFYKHNKIFLQALQIAKKNMLKLLIFFYKKQLIKYTLIRRRGKKYRLILSKAYLFFNKKRKLKRKLKKKNVKA